jgi:thiamine-phosphate pyrophosphorylase
MSRRPVESLLAGPLYAILDEQALGLRAIPKTARTLAEAGIRCLQIRAKQASCRDLYDTVKETLLGLEGGEAVLWLDDRADLAALFPVHGVHLGQRDLPAPRVREIVGSEVAIGMSTHNRQQVRQAAADPAVDLIAIGPVFPTRSKQAPDPVVGLELVSWARQQTDKPLVAIGGIQASNLSSVLGAGADAAAMIGALSRGDIWHNSRQLLSVLEDRG